MIITARISIFYLLIVLYFLIPGFVVAQESQSLSVTPPLFQISVAPGDIWQSEVKVVNNNSYELNVYADVVNFLPQGEGGQGRFIPILTDEEGGSTLAEWITVAGGPYTIAPEQSKNIQFFIEVPEDAPPGGHFAAILISTEPPPSEEAFSVRTSQVVASLFFTRIAGDITEAADIREFSVLDSFVSTPETTFKLRIENKGNVHLQPRGDIYITNMWGKERGIIPINNRSSFGNVLPNSIREFTFIWTGEPSITDIGRYKAIVSLSYGEDGIKNLTNITYFWVIPVKATLVTLAAFLLFGLFVTWGLRMYIRRMLIHAGIDVHSLKQTENTSIDQNDVRVSSYKTVTGPLRAGVSDLRIRLLDTHKLGDVIITFYKFILQYRVFFGSMSIVILGFIGIVFYIGEVSTDKRSYEVIFDRGDGEIVVNSEEIIKEQLKKTVKPISDTITQPYMITLINASGEPGVAANVAIMLEEKGYVIDSLQTEAGDSRKKTVIIFDAALLTDEAEVLSDLLQNALFSPIQDDAQNTLPTLKIIVGEDLK